MQRDLAGGVPASGVPAAAETDVDAVLDQMLARAQPDGCAPPAGAQQAAQADIPEEMKIGPLTRAQRAHFVFSQMKQGLHHWWECNRRWLLPTLIASLVVLLVLAVLTEGAVFEIIGSILEIIGAVMLGVSMVRAAIYLGEYVWKGVTGDIPAAAKSFARALAIIAIELVFLLLFNQQELKEGLKDGFQGALRAVGRTVTRTFERAGEAVEKLGQATLRGGRALGRNAAGIARAFVENGKLIMQGAGREVLARGMRSLEELGTYLLERTRFNRFRMWLEGDQVMLAGCLNPCPLCGNGDLLLDIGVEGRPMIGDLVQLAGRRKVAILVGVFDTAPSTVVKNLQGLSKAQRRALYIELAAMTSTDAMRARILGAAATGANSRALRAALLGAGEKAVGDAHHIVPSTHRLAEEARQILLAAGVDINVVANGVFLSEALHAGLHTTEYMEKITELLRGQSRAGVLSQLARIKAALRSGGLNAVMAL